MIVFSHHMCRATHARTEALIIASHPVYFFPSSIVPKWNKHNIVEIEAIFEFIFSFLHDDAFIILFILECKDVCQDVHTYLTTYDFTLVRDWWDLNVMNLCYGINPSTIVSSPSLWLSISFHCILIPLFILIQLALIIVHLFVYCSQRYSESCCFAMRKKQVQKYPSTKTLNSKSMKFVLVRMTCILTTLLRKIS